MKLFNQCCQIECHLNMPHVFVHELDAQMKDEYHIIFTLEHFRDLRGKVHQTIPSQDT